MNTVRDNFFDLTNQNVFSFSGLDLHFWRKICKNCKCGKESHDVRDDDIYGWVEFQLLGSKPNKLKKIGRREEINSEF